MICLHALPSLSQHASQDTGMSWGGQCKRLHAPTYNPAHTKHTIKSVSLRAECVQLRLFLWLLSSHHHLQFQDWLGEENERGLSCSQEHSRGDNMFLLSLVTWLESIVVLGCVPTGGKMSGLSSSKYCTYSGVQLVRCKLLCPLSVSQRTTYILYFQSQFRHMSCFLNYCYLTAEMYFLKLTTVYNAYHQDSTWILELLINFCSCLA